MIYDIIFLIVCIWILFFGGAAKVENSIIGYLGFWRFGEKALLIKLFVCLSLVIYILKILIK